MYNVGNFLNNKWGKRWDAQFFSIQQVDASVDSVTGQFIYEDFNDRDLNDLQEDRSLWEARVGVEFMF